MVKDVLLAKRIGKRVVPKKTDGQMQSTGDNVQRESEVGQQTMVTREEVEKGDR